jgi:hypothetical protein
MAADSGQVHFVKRHDVLDSCVGEKRENAETYQSAIHTPCKGVEQREEG